MDDWDDLSNVEEIINLQGNVGEELLSPWIVVVLGNSVVLIEGLLDLGNGDSDLGSEVLSVFQSLHESSSDVMLAVPFNFVGGSTVQDQSEWSLVLIHHSGDVVSSSEFITESLSVSIEDNSSASSESLSGQPLDLVVGVLWVDESGWVNLNPFHINDVSSERLGELNSGSVAMVSVGGGVVHNVGSVLLEQRGFSEIGSVSSGGEDDDSLFGELLSSLLVLDSNDFSSLLK